MLLAIRLHALCLRRKLQLCGSAPFVDYTLNYDLDFQRDQATLTSCGTHLELIV